MISVHKLLFSASLIASIKDMCSAFDSPRRALSHDSTLKIWHFDNV